MGTETKVFCSSCGVENLPGAKFCSACGAVMGAVAPPPAPSSGPAVVREGLIATMLQRIAATSMALSAVFTLFVAIFGLMGAFGLEWGTRTSGFLVTRALPGAGYILGAFLVIILNSVFVRRLVPRRRDVGMKTYLGYRRTLRERDGIRLLLSPAGLRPGVVVMSLLWLGLAAIAWSNIGSLADEGFDVKAGVYVCTVLPVLGMVSTLGVWPFRAETVYMDRQGVITRG